MRSFRVFFKCLKIIVGEMGDCEKISCTVLLRLLCRWTMEGNMSMTSLQNRDGGGWELPPLGNWRGMGRLNEATAVSNHRTDVISDVCFVVALLTVFSVQIEISGEI